MTIAELAKAFYEGNDEAAQAILRQLHLPNTKKGLRIAAEYLNKHHPPPQAILWNEPHENQLAHKIFEQTHKVKNHE